MKCSLLTLSTYIDGELSTDGRAELDAHLVGCARCSAGAATLREEKARLGQLARVRVAPDSVRLMLEQVGITGFTDIPAPTRPVAAAPGPPPEKQPWQAAQERAQTSSAALPWRPRRPAPLSQAIEAATAPHAPLAPAATPDPQPDLPFAGTIPTAQPPASGEAAPRPRPAPAPIEAPAARQAPAVPEPAPSPPPADVPGFDYPWPGAQVPADRGVPPVAEVAAGGGRVATGWGMSTPPPPPLAPPTRAPTSGGPMLWARLRDAVAVRMTLARHADRVEDGIQIVSGATPPRGRRLPAATVADPVPEVATEAADVELTGVSGVRPAPVQQPAEALLTRSPDAAATAPPVRPPDQPGPATPAEPVSWNAFGASSYPEQPPAPPVPARPVQLGRHSRAVAREQLGMTTRLSRAAAALAGALGDAAQAVGASARSMLKTTRGANPDRRIIAAIAAVAIVFISALVIGHRSTPSTRASAGTAPPASATGHASTAAPSTPAATGAPASTAPTGAPAAVTAFGAGGSGFQVRDIRYGQQVGYLRVVFDMGPVDGSSGSSPRVTVADSPNSVLVTLNGTLPAGSTGTPPARGVISSVTLVSSSGGKSVYRIVVTRPVTVTGLFLSGTSPPLRFVLDLH